MKTNIHAYLFLVTLFTLCSFSACDKDEINVLPQETQSGKNTFGCLIDNKLFIGGGYYSFIGISPLSAQYDRVYKRLTISAYNKTDETIALLLINPLQNATQKLSRGTYSNGAADGTHYIVLDGGEIYLTKLDTINKIVSGHFSFTGKYADLSDTFIENGDSVKITQGRFDIGLNMSND